MKDPNKKINLLYALFYEFICVPILGVISYIILDFFKIFSSEYFFYSAFKILMVLLVIGANISIILLLASLMMHNIKKLESGYHLTIGLIALFITFLIKMYYGHLLGIACSEASRGLSCATIIKYNNTITFIFVVQIVYFVIFLASQEYLRAQKRILEEEKAAKKKKTGNKKRTK